MSKSKKAKPEKSKEKSSKKVTGKLLRGWAVDQVYFLVATTCFAAGLYLFAVPNQIAQSGISGIAIMINRFLGTPIGINNLVLNIPLVILALIFLGWKFVSKTLFVTVELSLVLYLMERFLPQRLQYTGDPLLASVFGGVLCGLGLALPMMRGTTSGGMDIVGWLVRKRWPHISIGRVILTANTGIVLAGAFIFKDINSALYAAIMIFITSRIVDSMLYGQNNGKMFYIFTQKTQELSGAIMEQMTRGVSILTATGAYTGERKDMILCVVRRSEVTRLRRLVKEHDPGSFMIMAEAQEIFGQGFDRPLETPEKKAD